MLALADWEEDRCPLCGGDPAECQSPDTDRNNPRARWIYRFDLPVECNRSTALRIGMDEYAKADPSDRRGLIHRVRKDERGKPRR